jgi:anti-sigma factor RsiW
MISPHVDGELGPAEGKIFAEHIQNCAACREALEDTRAVRDLFVSAGKFSAPLGFSARVMANIEEKEASLFRKLFRSRPFFLRTVEVAAALVVIAFGMLSGNVLMSGGGAPARVAEVRDSFHLDVFEAAPPNSVAGAYLSMIEAGHEK